MSPEEASTHKWTTPDANCIVSCADCNRVALKQWERFFVLPGCVHSCSWMVVCKVAEEDFDACANGTPSI